MLEGLSKHRIVIAHIAVWVVYFCTPLFITSLSRSSLTAGDWVRFTVAPLSVMLVFYINYFLLIDRFLVKRRFFLFLLLNILTIMAVSFAVHFILRLPAIADLFPRPPRAPRRAFNPWFFFRNSSYYILAVGIGTAVRMTQRWYAAEQKRKDLERERALAELQNLKNQLNPHFLFNSLNNIYSFIRTDADKAQRTMDDLCQLLRYLLYECNNPTVCLADEISFISNYIELMRVRLPQNFSLDVSLPAAAADHKIAPGLLIMPVENAFKYGTRNNPDSIISISIKIEDDKLVSEVTNSCSAETQDNKEPSNGVGLGNLRRRLELLYPGHHSFECGRTGNIYRAYLCVDLKYSVEQ